jgi:hypothetical protein
MAPGRRQVVDRDAAFDHHSCQLDSIRVLDQALLEGPEPRDGGDALFQETRQLHSKCQDYGTLEHDFTKAFILHAFTLFRQTRSEAREERRKAKTSLHLQ